MQAAVAVFALAAVAFAQPPADRERQLLEIIEREQAQNGPHSEGLIGPLSRLAALYRDNGDDALAMATIERVLQVVRANDGLHSLEQITPIEQLIAIEESIGNAAAAWDLEQRLLILARRHPGDLRTVPVLRDAAEKRVAILARYQDGAVPPQIELGCYSGWPHSDSLSSCSGAGTKSEISRAILSDAQRNYADAIAVLLRHGQYGREELRVLETGIIDTILLAEVHAQSSLTLVQTEVEPWRTWAAALGDIARVQVPNPTGLPLVPARASNTWSFDYRLGRESLVRLFAYELATPSPLSVQIEAFLRIADWDLLHGENTPAMREYEQVYRLLGEGGEGGARASIDALFAPQLPVALPAHMPTPLATAAGDTYLDVAFEVTQFGESRKIEIADATADATAADGDALVALIKRSRFRPRSKDGEPARASPVVVRYYLN